MINKKRLEIEKIHAEIAKLKADTTQINELARDKLNAETNMLSSQAAKYGKELKWYEIVALISAPIAAAAVIVVILLVGGRTF